MDSVHIFEGHNDRIFSIALTSLPDGRKYAASASYDRTVRIWCLNTFKHKLTIEYSDFVWRVFIVLTPKPCVVAYISADDKIQVSDLETGETLNTFYGRLIFASSIPLYKNPVILIATGNEDITFLDATNGDVLKQIVGGFEKVFRAVISNAHTNFPPTLIFTTWNSQNRRSTIQTCELYDDNSEKVINKGINSNLLFDGDSRNGVTSLVVTLSNKPQLLCSGHYDFKARLWSIEKKCLLIVLEGHTDYVGSVACWKGEEKIVLTGSTDGTIKVWDTDTGRVIKTLTGHSRDIWSVTVTQGHKPLIVSGSFDRSIRVWDINSHINEIKWERRKNYCIFINDMNKLIELPNNKMEILGFNSNILLKVFCDINLRRLIATYI